MKVRKLITIVAVIAVTVASVYGYMLYREYFSPNTAFSDNQKAIFIPTNSTYAEVQEIVRPYVESMDKFKATAEKKSYDRNVRSGKFIIRRGMTSNDIINALRVPVAVNISLVSPFISELPLSQSIH